MTNCPPGAKTAIIDNLLITLHLLIYTSLQKDAIRTVILHHLVYPDKYNLIPLPMF